MRFVPGLCGAAQGEVTWVGAAGEAIVLLGSTPHRLVELGNGDGDCGGGWLRASYHVSFLRQRMNLYLCCPPADALALPPHIARLIGYCKPGPVLNKWG